VININTAILIPAYQPDEKLVMLVEQLAVLDFSIIMIVNDGSGMECDNIFDSCKKYGNCKVVMLDKNMGKGYALKTGMKCLLNENFDIDGCITADADGQHLPEDILKVKAAFEKDPDTLILGCRNFEKVNVPFKSRFGNKITRALYKIFTHQTVSDTQTGLRAIPAYAMRKFADLEGDRYEFEMNMLMASASNGIPVKEVRINTVYIDENKASHFRPFSDSVKVYGQFLKFIVSSLVSSGIDIGLFTIFQWILKRAGFPAQLEYQLLFATAMARACSATVNYNLNKRLVFRNHENDRLHALKYFSLCVIQLLCSWLLLSGFTKLGLGNVVVLKIAADVILFLLSFAIQKIYIFRKVKNEA
jgi:putative flippase GtrA